MAETGQVAEASWGVGQCGTGEMKEGRNVDPAALFPSNIEKRENNIRDNMWTKNNIKCLSEYTEIILTEFLLPIPRSQDLF